jgi:hypothetical protein
MYSSHTAKALGIQPPKKKKKSTRPVPFCQSPLAKKGSFTKKPYLYYFDNAKRFVCAPRPPNEQHNCILVRNFPELRVYLAMLPNLLRRFNDPFVRKELVRCLFHIVKRVPGVTHFPHYPKQASLGPRFRLGQFVFFWVCLGCFRVF